MTFNFYYISIIFTVVKRNIFNCVASPLTIDQHLISIGNGETEAGVTDHVWSFEEFVALLARKRSGSNRKGGKALPLRTMFYPFNQPNVNTVYEVGGVYGLAQAQIFNPGHYTILYVGKSGNLKERLQYHLNNPPTAGITHFFVERIDNAAARTAREEALIAEFQPVGNTLLK